MKPWKKWLPPGSCPDEVITHDSKVRRGSAFLPPGNGKEQLCISHPPHRSAGACLLRTPHRSTEENEYTPDSQPEEINNSGDNSNESGENRISFEETDNNINNIDKDQQENNEEEEK